MSDNNEKIFDSPASDPDDEFWLEHGRQMVVESLPAIRSAANAMIAALGVMEGIYLGILGFRDFIPETLPFAQKIVFASPFLIWLAAIYCCIGVVMTRELQIQLYSPEDIKRQSAAFVLKKQRQLKWGFWLFAIGLLAVFALVVIRLYWKNL